MKRLRASAGSLVGDCDPEDGITPSVQIKTAAREWKRQELRQKADESYSQSREGAPKKQTEEELLKNWVSMAPLLELL